MAHKNQMNTFPVTASFPWAATASSTWVSVRASAKTVMELSARVPSRVISKNKYLVFRFNFRPPSYNESGLAIKVPTILVNSRRHQAFISSRKNCPPSIRHQDLKMFPVAWLEPVANATGAV